MDDILLSKESLLYRGVREKYLDVHLKDMPDDIKDMYDLLKHANGIITINPDPEREEPGYLHRISTLNAYLVKYYLVKYEGHKTIQVANISMFINFKDEGLIRLGETDYLIVEFADLFSPSVIMSKQILSAVSATLLERIGTDKCTVLEYFTNTPFPNENDNPFAKFVANCAASGISHEGL